MDNEKRIMQHVREQKHEMYSFFLLMIETALNIHIYNLMQSHAAFVYYIVFHRPECIYSQFSLRQWLFLFHTHTMILTNVRARNRNSKSFYFLFFFVVVVLGEDETSDTLFSSTFVFTGVLSIIGRVSFTAS